MHDHDAHGMYVILVDKFDSGKRLDAVIASHIPACSRSYASALISKGSIQVRGTIKKPGYRVKSGDKIHARIPPSTPMLFKPEPIEIDICYEDDSIIIVNKQPGIVTHPAPGHYTGTLVNALLYHCPELAGVGEENRPGIVHRLDKDTSGVLVIAKSTSSLNHLAVQFKSRKVEKDYLAIVCGEMESEFGAVTLPIGRHPVDRKRMSTISRNGRKAETLWKVRERFKEATLLDLSPKTGRTHQIRVHCAAIHHPIIGDSVYNRRRAGKNIPGIIKPVPRQMLHALRIRFSHPITKKIIVFEAPIPGDMKELIDVLRN